VHLGLVAIVVSEYDPAIRFFTDVLGFELVEDRGGTCARRSVVCDTGARARS
jgi:catechol 2,3-dioxygenase-like lactoylglutathione lyase family enzyme